jgi:rhodanese-related sulfurtransferase
MIGEITPAEFVATLAGAPSTLLIDVREGWELEIARLPQALHVPMAEIPARLAEIDRQRTIVVMCHAGVRSRCVAGYLAEQGYPSVLNLAGGIDAWAREVDFSLATY